MSVNINAISTTEVNFFNYYPLKNDRSYQNINRDAKLPIILMEQVFSFLDSKDVSNLAIVCRSWAVSININLKKRYPCKYIDLTSVLLEQQDLRAANHFIQRAMKLANLIYDRIYTKPTDYPTFLEELATLKQLDAQIFEGVKNTTDLFLILSRVNDHGSGFLLGLNDSLPSFVPIFVKELKNDKIKNCRIFSKWLLSLTKGTTQYEEAKAFFFKVIIELSQEAPETAKYLFDSIPKEHEHLLEINMNQIESIVHEKNIFSNEQTTSLFAYLFHLSAKTKKYSYRTLQLALNKSCININLALFIFKLAIHQDFSKSNFTNAILDKNIDLLHKQYQNVLELMRAWLKEGDPYLDELQVKQGIMHISNYFIKTCPKSPLFLELAALLRKEFSINVVEKHIDDLTSEKLWQEARDFIELLLKENFGSSEELYSLLETIDKREAINMSEEEGVINGLQEKIRANHRELNFQKQEISDELSEEISEEEDEIDYVFSEVEEETLYDYDEEQLSIS